MGQSLWFASRGTGLVAALLLTATTALGAIHSGRVTSARWPRFTLHALHRNVSLLTLAFLAVHVASAIIDPYAGIAWSCRSSPRTTRSGSGWARSRST
jgi:hypothetical protein